MITSSKINTVQDKIKKAIAQIEKDENVKIEFASCRYNSAYYTTQMKVVSKSTSEKVESVYESICKSLGFTQNVIGMKFTGKNGLYEVTDIKTRNRKYPVIAKCISTGISYKYTTEQIKKLMGGDKIINRNKNLERLID